MPKYPSLKKAPVTLFILLVIFTFFGCDDDSTSSSSPKVTGPGYPVSTNTTRKYVTKIDSGKIVSVLDTTIEKTLGYTEYKEKQAIEVQIETQLAPLFLGTFDTTYYSANDYNDVSIYLKTLTQLLSNSLGNFKISGFDAGWYPYLIFSDGNNQRYDIFDTRIDLTLDTALTGLETPLTVPLTIQITGTVIGEETIEVNEQNYSATHIQLNAELIAIIVPITDFNIDLWFADNIGFVKQETESFSIDLSDFVSNAENVTFTIPKFTKTLISVSN